MWWNNTLRDWGRRMSLAWCTISFLCDHVIMWSCDHVIMWSCDMIMWFCVHVMMWLIMIWWCDDMIMWVCDHVIMWYDHVIMWLCDVVIMWSCVGFWDDHYSLKPSLQYWPPETVLAGWSFLFLDSSLVSRRVTCLAGGGRCWFGLGLVGTGGGALAEA